MCCSSSPSSSSPRLAAASDGSGALSSSARSTPAEMLTISPVPGSTRSSSSSTPTLRTRPSCRVRRRLYDREAMTTNSADVLIRPMSAGDVTAAERLSNESYFELDQRTYQRGWPDPSPRSPERRTSWAARTAHLLSTDPGGCWVAEADGELVGMAVSYNRELMWLLASFAVRPGLQGAGIGAQLLAAALHHGRGSLRGMLAASADPKAVRRYRLAGFDLHPQMLLWGHVDRAVIPVVERVRDGSPGDFDLMDSVDRRTRGAAHGPDHAVLAREFHLLVSDSSTGSGYVYVNDTGSPVLLAATNRRTATAPRLGGPRDGLA